MAGIFQKFEYNKLQLLRNELPDLLSGEEAIALEEQFDALLDPQAPAETLNQRMQELIRLVAGRPDVLEAYKRFPSLEDSATRFYESLGGNPTSPGVQDDELYRCTAKGCRYSEYRLYEGQSMRCKRNPAHGQMILVIK